jgi:hypothetical protein
MKNRFALPLALFLSYWLVQGQALALGPGVPWGTEQEESVAGTYTGVGVPHKGKSFFSGNNAGLDPEDFLGANSLLVFTVGVAQTGFNSGDIVIFVNGASFEGDLIVFGNAVEQQVSGFIDVEANFLQEYQVDTGEEDQNGDPIFSDEFSIPYATGKLVCSVKNAKTGVKSIYSTSTAKVLKGKAQIKILGDVLNQLPEEISYDLQGVKQSDQVINSSLNGLPLEL